MTPQNFFDLVLAPSASTLPLDNSLESRVMLMAIAGQESAWTDRIQIGGPARGYWQFDMTAILDLLADPSLGPGLQASCAVWDIPSDPTTLYQALAWHDPIAYEAARRLLLADPAPLPAVGDETGALACYLKNWNPGDPKPATWPAIYAQAVAVVK